MEPKAYDAIVIGSGPGGYVCAIRLAQLGFKTALVERTPKLGGTCLNVGCIPSKALLDSTEHVHKANKEFAEHGINIGKVAVDMAQMIKRKQDVVDATVQGVEFLMKKNKIDVHYGHGRFVDGKTVEVLPMKNGQPDEAAEAPRLSAPRIVIATGSEPATIPGVSFDGKRIISSTEALEITQIPKKMVVIGGGIIGLELGSVYARLGTQVDVIEYMDRLIPGMDAELGKELQKVLKKQLGINFHLKHKVTSVKADAKSATVTAESPKGETLSWTADYCLVAVGRKPYTATLGLDKAGVQLDDRGRVHVNDHLETSAQGIYAIGDVVRGAMLAHKAEDEGVFLAERLAGQKPHINYNCIPSVVYTWPEVAAVGYTEEQLKEAGTPYKKGKFPFMASGRARASMDTDGFVKVLAHEKTDEILGVHMIGPRTADMIAEAVTAMEFRASAEDLGMFSHAHPTFTEATKEAALAATGNRALHL